MFLKILIEIFLFEFSTFFVSSNALVTTARNDGPPACRDLIAQSFSSGYEWSGTSALTLAQCMQQSVPQPDSCVFYTAGDRDNAILYAFQNNITTIYDVYDPQWFDTSIYPARAWQESGVLRKVFQVTSRAYAMSCTGQASLVAPLRFEPCPTSIWVTDEYDAIKNKLSKITMVMKVSLVRKMDGVWTWITERLAGYGLASRSMRRRGVYDVFKLQKTMEERHSITENLLRADKFGVDDAWATHADSSCRY